MNCATVDYLENEIRDMEHTIEGLAQERTELEDALRRLVDVVEDVVDDLRSITELSPIRYPKATIWNITDRLMAALEDEGCGSTE